MSEQNMDAEMALLASVQGKAVIKRRADGKVILMLPGTFEWNEFPNPASAYFAYRDWSAKQPESRQGKVLLLNIAPDELSQQ